MGDRGKIVLRPLFELVFVVFGLVFEDLVSQRVGIYVVNQFGHVDDELVQSKVDESLLTGYSSQVFLEILFWVLYLVDHDCQKLGV